MSTQPPNRARLARRSLTATLALCAALLVTPAVSGAATTRHQAAGKALAALGSRDGSAPVIVFGLKRPVARLGHERAFFFYEDRGPYRSYPHAGRVARVGVRSGKVRLSRTINRRPLVNGKLPAFLTSSKRYASARYRVFARLRSAPAPVRPAPQFGSDPFGPLSFNQPPKADDQVTTAKKNVPKNITLTGSDVDGDLLTFEIFQPPDHGTLSGQPPDVVYTPDPNYLGSDKFGFKSTDGESYSNMGHVTITVVPLGSPPTVVTSSGCTAYVEQTPAVAVDPALAVTDPDDTRLDRARIWISADFVRGDDLVFTDQNGIAGSYDDQIGVLTLNGTATVANYQAALRTVGYRNLAGPSPSATKGVSFTVNDAGSDSAPATKQICITEGDSSNNNKPVGETSEGALEYIENDGPVPIDAGFQVTDPDSADLAGATVRFAPSAPGEDDELGGGAGDPVFNFFPDEDELLFTDQNGITGSYDDVNGVLTLTGTSSVANYQAAIQSVAYENSSEDPSAETRAIRFQLTDTTGAISKFSSRGILVTPVNDAPVVTTSDGATGYTEGDPATTIDSGLTAGDVDDTDIEGGQVRISDGFESGDELVYVEQSGISGEYSSGVLTLTGTASEADYQTALRSIQFTGTSDNPPATKTVEFVINDGDLDSDPATRTISVTPVNDKPVLDPTDTTLSYTEGDGPVAADPGITASDVDSATFTGATVQVTGEGASSDDKLAFPDTNTEDGITGLFDDETGVLTLTGTASVADYQAALQSVTYENTSDNPSTDARTVAFQVDDGGATDNLSDQVTRDVSMTPVNDAPAVTTSDGSTSYVGTGQPETVDSALSVVDVDDSDLESAEVRISSGFESGDDLTFVDQPGITGDYDDVNGVLTLTGTASVADYETVLRSVQYDHTPDNPQGSRTVEFTVNDGELGSAAATKVVDLNDKPVLDTTDTALAYTAGDGAVAADPGITASDPDSATLTGATVQVTGEGASTDDKLAFPDTNTEDGITGTVDEESGLLTLTGTASVADYQAALQSVTYENTSATPSTDARAVVFTVDDGAPVNNLSDPATRDVVVTLAE